ncbi:MAG: hypothetical protein ABIK09_02750 [Pseudomonadota bacterium]
MTDVVTLETGALAFLGGAVARATDGKVVFVRGAAPDEVVEVRLFQQRARFDLAVVTRVIRPSVCRVEPFCPLAGTCGGCDWQHVAVAAQRDACRQILSDALGRAGVEMPPEEVVPSPEERAWRHRARLHIASDGGRVRLGFFRPGTHEVVNAPECPVLMRPLLDAAAALRAALAGRGAAGTVELSLADEGVLVAINLSNVPRDLDGLQVALAQSKAIRGGILGAPGLGSHRFSEATGSKILEVTGRTWRIPVAAGAFLQANWAANGLLVERVIAAVEAMVPPSGRILELYSGSGNMTLPLLGAGLAVEAWESSGPAVRALEGAAPRGATLRVHHGDAVRALGQDGPAPDLVLLDPPRAGARAVCEALRDHPTQGIVYVSCDPYTLGRDLGILVDAGWRVDRVIPVDLFPHTPHIETVTALRRR